MLHLLQDTKCDPLLLLPLLLSQPTQKKLKQQQPQQQQQQQQKTTQFKYENSTKESKLHFSDLLYIYFLSYICQSQLRYYDQLLMGPHQIYLTFSINILQDLHGQSSHFQVLMRFLKRAREAASRISIGTCSRVGQHDMEQHRVRISVNEDFLSGRCGSFGDCTYFLLT